MIVGGYYHLEEERLEVEDAMRGVLHRLLLLLFFLLLLPRRLELGVGLVVRRRGGRRGRQRGVVVALSVRPVRLARKLRSDQGARIGARAAAPATATFVAAAAAAASFAIRHRL